MWYIITFICFGAGAVSCKRQSAYPIPEKGLSQRFVLYILINFMSSRFQPVRERLTMSRLRLRMASQLASTPTAMISSHLLRHCRATSIHWIPVLGSGPTIKIAQRKTIVETYANSICLGTVEGSEEWKSLYASLPSQLCSTRCWAGITTKLATSGLQLHYDTATIDNVVSARSSHE